MNTESAAWLCFDDFLDADHPRQVFSGAQGCPGDSASTHFSPLAAGDFPQRWRELSTAAHADLDRCAAMLNMLRPVSGDAQAVSRAFELACDRLAPEATGSAWSLLPRVCVLAGLTGRLVRDAYDYANVRVVMGGALIGYQLVCAKLAGMVIADEIVEQHLIAALDVPRRAREDAGWRGLPALSEQGHVTEIARCVAAVLSLYIEIHAGHAFVQRAASVPVLAVAQALLEGIQAAGAGRA